MKKLYDVLKESKFNAVIFIGVLLLLGYIVGFTSIKLGIIK